MIQPINRIHDLSVGSSSLITAVTWERQFLFTQNPDCRALDQIRSSYSLLFSPVSGGREGQPLAIKCCREDICGITWSPIRPLWFKHAAMSS